MKKTFKNVLSLLALFAILSITVTSCMKEKISPNPDDQLRKSKNKSTSAARDGVYDLLGYGYNVHEEYGVSSSATYQVIDVAALHNSFSGRVEIDRSKTQDGKLASGENAASYTKGLSAHITAVFSTGIPLFKQTIKASFNDSSSYDAKMIYASYSKIIKQKTLKINAPVSILRNYLTPEFIADLQNETPAYIVNHYGTHVLTNVILGGKLQVLYQSETTNSYKKSSAELGLDLKLSAVFNINAGVQTNSGSASHNFNQRLHYKTIGGDPTLGLVDRISVDNAAPTVNIAPWQATVTEANSEMIDIGLNGLMLISDLVADSVKRAALESYINQYMIDGQLSLTHSKIPLYEFYSYVQTDHWLHTNRNVTDPYPSAQWQYRGVNFRAYGSQFPGTVPVYEYYSAVQTDHWISADPHLADLYPSAQWQNYGVLFYAFTTQMPGTVPLYEFYHSGSKDHFFTTNQYATSGQSGWTNYGVRFYVFPA